MSRIDDILDAEETVPTIDRDNNETGCAKFRTSL